MVETAAHAVCQPGENMSQLETRPLFSRTQVVLLAALVLILAAGLAAINVRRLRASEITLTPGDDSQYSFKLDVNTATWQEFSLLRGIGEKKARAIVDYREQHGPFARIDDLTSVPGIGPATIEEIDDYITIGPARE